MDVAFEMGEPANGSIYGRTYALSNNKTEGEKKSHRNTTE